MSAQEVQVATASSADLAADMERHRYMYRTFLRLLRYVAIGCAVVLVIVFFVMN